MTRKRKKELRTMDGNYEKNEKKRPKRPNGQVSEEKIKIEECSIYEDSYFNRSNGRLAVLAEFDKTDSTSTPEANYANSFYSGLKKKDKGK